MFTDARCRLAPSNMSMAEVSSGDDFCHDADFSCGASSGESSEAAGVSCGPDSICCASDASGSSEALSEGRDADDAARDPGSDCSEANSETVPAADDVNVWRPGINCGPHLHRDTAPLTSQGQVFVANAYIQLRRLSLGCLKLVLTELTGSLTQVSHSKLDYASLVLSTLFGVGVNMARKTLGRLRAAAWEPSESAGRAEAAVREPRNVAEANQIAIRDRAMRIRVREVLGCASQGEPDQTYVRRMTRLSLYPELELGTKYLSKEFCILAESLLAVAVRSLQAREMDLELPSLGIASDISLTWDGVSLGQSSFSRRDQ